jgi:DhnA family fructose-bisphosphate aldolase class Ia
MKRRIQHLFREDGRTLIVAMDHAAFSDRPLPGLSHPGEIIKKVVCGGADAVMTTFGTACHFSEELAKCGLILTIRHDDPSVEEAVHAALAAGADAIKRMIYPWLDSDPYSVTYGFRTGDICMRWQLPFLAEVVPGGFQAGPELRTPEKIAAGARIGAECGADMVKTFYPGSPGGLRVVVENCYVPVVVLGGPRMDNERDLLEVVRGTMEGGGRGVAMGNNIWRHSHPDKLVAAIATIIHDGATVDQAMSKLA